MSRRVLRYGPMALTALVAVGTLACLELSGVGLTGRSAVALPPTATATATPPALGDAEACAALAELSALAAGRVGALALVEDQDRRDQARLTALALRGLADRAAQVEHGEMLAVVLIDLADALENYDLPGVTAASAANAALRERYTSCAINNLR